VKNRPAPPALTRPRAAILAALREQPDPVAVGALATLIGRHPNTLREHLDALVAAGLVVRHAATPHGRGRPAWLYEALGPKPTAEDYPELAASLAWSLGGGVEDVTAQAREAGRRFGRDLSRERGAAPRPSAAEARREAVSLLADLGFIPEADETTSRVRLTRCPLLQAAHVNRDVVCTLHVGLVQGALEQYGAGDEPVTLVPFAEPGACLLTFSDGTDAAAPPARR
jgi:predicted ArsR family transcriptional regulator